MWCAGRSAFHYVPTGKGHVGKHAVQEEDLPGQVEAVVDESAGEEPKAAGRRACPQFAVGEHVVKAVLGVGVGSGLKKER